MRVLVTGIAGFVGRHLARHLWELGHDVWGVVRPGENIEKPMGNDLPEVSVFPVDITDRVGITDVVRCSQPDAVIHLAAVSSVGLSWTDPTRTFQVNVLGTLALLEAIKESAVDALVVSVGSGEEYGLVLPEDLPITEAHPVQPRNPYAVSKAAQGWLALQYYHKFGVRVVHFRPFNHIGPGQGRGFITSDWASQIAMIERGLQPPVLRVGNLQPRRDYLDVRDVVRAYVLALKYVQPGEIYNLASGRAVSGEELLTRLLSLTNVEVEVVVDAALLRPVDVPIIVGDARKLRQATNWQPRYTLDKTLRDILDYWRNISEATKCATEEPVVHRLWTGTSSEEAGLS